MNKEDWVIYLVYAILFDLFILALFLDVIKPLRALMDKLFLKAHKMAISLGKYPKLKV